MDLSGKRIVAFIPIRGGSKSIPLKNIALLAGRPLAYWVINACSESSHISEVFVATDSDQIRRCIEGLGLPKVTVIDRGTHTATDQASTESAMLEFAASRQFNDVMLVQATSPLLRAKDVDLAVEKYLVSEADSLLSVVRTKRFMWTSDGDCARPANYDPLRRPRRQEWDGQLVENGAMYLTSRDRLLETGCRISGKIAAYEMPEETYFEIDEPSDWAIVEGLLTEQRRRDTNLAKLARQVKLIAVDVDGTLTDAGMYYTEVGDVMKKFCTRDGMGLELLRKCGIEPCIITGECSPIVEARARKLKISRVFIGIQDKKATLEALLDELHLTWDQVAYVGDDLNDMEVMVRSGLSACPADAAAEIRRVAKYVCHSAGGHGAVREVCDLIRSYL